MKLNMVAICCTRSYFSLCLACVQAYQFFICSFMYLFYEFVYQLNLARFLFIWWFLLNNVS